MSVKPTTGITDSGTLYICATPIGNLEDITLRVLRVLKEVDLIAAEDTRVTRKLLTRYEIDTRMTSYHEHNEAAKGKELVEMMKSGRSVALVSDAGMPGISDPGHRLIKLCIDEGVRVEPLPGPSSLVTAIVVSGLPTDSFIFQGFLPRKRGERAALLTELLSSRRTVVVFESPHRLAATLGEVAEIDPDRPTVIARELTKKFEQVMRGSSSELYETVNQKQVKGEIVLLFGPVEARNVELSEDDLRVKVLDRTERGMSKKEAIAAVAKEFGIEKRRVYNVTINRH